jgi:hypothetical protein
MSRALSTPSRAATRIARAAAGALFAAALSGCAPVALYRGPAPAPGAITDFAGAPSPHIAAGTTDAAHHYLGALEPQPGADSLIVLIGGDNRPGQRTRSHPTLWRAVRKMSLANPYKLGRGLLALPVFLVAAIVPTLDGPRDLLALCTHVWTGGAEVRVLKSMSALFPADLVLSSGDLVTYGDRGKLWEIFVARFGPLRARAPFLAAPGNHESMADPTGRANWASAMGAPARDRGFWYAFDAPEADARFVFLDTNALLDSREGEVAALAEAQLAWADSVLATGPRRRIIILHHGLLSGGHYRDVWNSNHPESVSAQRRVRLLEMCAARNVTAVIAGHEHLYQRAYLKTPGGGFWHITSAGAGSPLYALDRGARDVELAKPLPAGLSVVPASVNSRSVFHFCRLILPRGDAADRPLALDVLRVGSGGGATRMDWIDLGQAPGATPANAAPGSTSAP